MTTADLRFQRLIFFTDAVFAIAITLLVVDLRPPDVPAPGYEAALRAYLAQPAPFIATAIGFVVVGSYWMSHRSIFALIERSDARLVWTNTLFLLGIVVQPFFTAALAEHDPNRTSVIAYAGCQVVAGLAQLGLWAVALRGRHLLVTSITPRLERYITIQLVRAPAAFAISIPVTLLLGPVAGMVSWGAIIVAAVLISRAFPDIPRDPDEAQRLRAA
jgi:uncharacterized membrane protein